MTLFRNVTLRISSLILFFLVILTANGQESRKDTFSSNEVKKIASDYVIIAEKTTQEDSGWKVVVEALQKKYSATTLCWEDGTDKLQKKLKELRPTYVCFVARPDELARDSTIDKGSLVGAPLHGKYYHDVGAFMRSIDNSTYNYAIWAVLTGATPEDAMRVVTANPLTVSRGLSHVGSGWLDLLESGVSFNEGAKGVKYTKEAGKPMQEVLGPDDTTEQFVKELNSEKVDMVSSSGHASEHDWQMGYNYKNGKIVNATGDLLGVDTSNKTYKITTTNPKIYYSPGNCLIARVDGKDCMALGWIHHGAMQFFGHTGLQGAGGSCYEWGVSEYFLSLQGRFSFAESVWLNQQAMRWELTKEQNANKYLCCRGDKLMREGKEVVWETTVLYGDPAWEARVKPVTDPMYKQELVSKKIEDGQEELTFEVTMCRAILPSRPAMFLLKNRGRTQIKIVQGPEDLVISDNFALLPFWKIGQSVPKPGDKYKAVVIVKEQ